MVIGTAPEHADQTVHEYVELGIKHVWMHRGPGAGSVSESAAAYGREHGVTVIPVDAPACSARPPRWSRGDASPVHDHRKRAHGVAAGVVGTTGLEPVTPAL